MEAAWYSACFRVVCLIEGIGAVDEARPVHIFQASDWDQALARAFELGGTHEQEYVNADGAAVRWRFAQVLTLDQFELADGAEVYSTLAAVPLPLPFDTAFEPKSVTPAQASRTRPLRPGADGGCSRRRSHLERLKPGAPTLALSSSDHVGGRADLGRVSGTRRLAGVSRRHACRTSADPPDGSGV